MGHVDLDAAMAHLGVLEHFGIVVDHRTGDAGVHQRLHKLVLAPWRDHIAQSRGKLRAIQIATAQSRKAWVARQVGNRSEEHTSELQSLMRISYAVFCLKKKT